MNSLPIIATISLLITNVADRRLLANFLHQTGYRIQTLTALDAITAESAGSLLIIDELSARRQGTALLAMKRRCLPLYLPMLLALNDNGSASPWLRAGFDDVLRMPLNKDDLLARLEAFLRLHQHSAAIIQEGAQRYRNTFDLAPIGIVHISLDGHITLANTSACTLLQYANKELTGKLITTLIEPDGRPALQDAIAALLAGSANTVPAPLDQRCVRRDGSTLWTAIRITLVRDTAGQPMHLIAIIEDISARHLVEYTLRQSERFIKSTIDALSEHICVIDHSGKVLAVNTAWRNFGTENGHPPAIAWDETNYLDVCDRAAASGIEDAHLFAAGMRAVLFGEQEQFSLEYPCNSPTEERWFLARVTRFQMDGPVRVVVSHENITAAKQAQNHLSYMAHYDSLTGLPNRVLFYERLKHELLQAERSKWTLAVMFVDLDHFKMVNDTLGHAAGDSLLQQASSRIVECLRGNDTVGRLGGDEFGLFLPDLTSAQDAAVVAEKIMVALANPFQINGAETFVTSSIGITIYPEDGNDADLLVCSADTAMYRAKQQGRNNYQYFTAHMNAQMREHARLENGLRKALERNELSLHYQPQIDIHNGKIIGMEALMRWQHPELGAVSPAVFIPIAEETGLIVAFGEWALRTACAQNKTWQDAGFAPIVMAVNLSARQFKNKTLGKTVQQVLQHTALPGQYLELELTEGMVMDNVPLLIDAMQELKSLGVRLSLDDFGTGYSNLAYLKRFPLDMIKIDKSFVNGIGQGGDEGIIAATVITLGHSLKLKVIAEGVETEPQMRALQMLGCDMMQGYLFSKPLSAPDATALLGRHQVH